MHATKSFQNFLVEYDRAGFIMYEDDNDIIELVELDTCFVLLTGDNDFIPLAGYDDVDQFSVSVFHKAVGDKRGDFSGCPVIDTDDYKIAFDKFIQTILELK